jgi:hypothetical protein
MYFQSCLRALRKTLTRQTKSLLDFLGRKVLSFRFSERRKKRSGSLLRSTHHLHPITATNAMAAAATSDLKLDCLSMSKQVRRNPPRALLLYR